LGVLFCCKRALSTKPDAIVCFAGTAQCSATTVVKWAQCYNCSLYPLGPSSISQNFMLMNIDKGGNFEISNHRWGGKSNATLATTMKQAMVKPLVAASVVACKPDCSQIRLRDSKQYVILYSSSQVLLKQLQLR